ncbi:MAG: methyltransferase domain-containing protein [Sphingobacteriia bacterium]|nr:MAG: methyltransferase domain-containing protein [Sphingobacteriia bacterium]TAG30544.1 MAG: methyltransferase domain-containing protein [Sphingobacteriia bacterium]TAH06506.1 MAG: methyltransferase domain-containing protein [Sphingobacteriia bacterium]
MKLLFPLSILFSTLIYGQKENNSEDVLRFYRTEIELLALKTGDTLVDVGSEYGLINAMYASLIPNIYQILIDIDKSKLNKKILKYSYKAIKKEYNKEFDFNYDFEISQKDAIPLVSSSYSKILCRKSFHEFSEQSKMVKEMHRILRESGEVIVIDVLPNRKGLRDNNCNMLYLMPDQIIKVFSENNFILKSQTQEVMNLMDKGVFSVITFVKSNVSPPAIPL